MPSIVVNMSSANDDGMEATPGMGDWINNGDHIGITIPNIHSFIRFQNVPIPYGATITSAVLVGYVSDGSGVGFGTAWLANRTNPGIPVNGDDLDESATAGNIYYSTYFDSSTVVGQSCTLNDMRDALNAIVNTLGWASGNSLLFGFVGSSASTNSISFASVENTLFPSVELYVTYEDPVGPVIDIEDPIHVHESNESFVLTTEMYTDLSSAFLALLTRHRLNLYTIASFQFNKIMLEAHIETYVFDYSFTSGTISTYDRTSAQSMYDNLYEWLVTEYPNHNLGDLSEYTARLSVVNSVLNMDTFTEAQLTIAEDNLRALRDMGPIINGYIDDYYYTTYTQVISVYDTLNALGQELINIYSSFSGDAFNVSSASLKTEHEINLFEDSTHDLIQQAQVWITNITENIELRNGINTLHKFVGRINSRIYF